MTIMTKFYESSWYFCAKYSIKYHAIFYILTYITDLNNIINDIIDEINNTEQLCHRPDGLLV